MKMMKGSKSIRFAEIDNECFDEGNIIEHGRYIVKVVKSNVVNDEQDCSGEGVIMISKEMNLIEDSMNGMDSHFKVEGQKDIMNLW